jgi:sulfide dehydrogenase cytochrome subunit
MIVRATLAATVLLGTAAAASPSSVAIVAAPPSQGIVVAAPPSPVAVVAVPPPGASSCSGCHGAVAPPAVLTGRDASEIAAALDAFRAGTRPAVVMDRIAKGFSHDESVTIATWLAAQK